MSENDLYLDKKREKIMAWYGILFVCLGFSIWSLVCAMVGASIVMTTRRQADIVRAAAEQSKWQAPDDISEMGE